MTAPKTSAELQEEALTAQRIADELRRQAIEARQLEKDARTPKMPDVVPSINGMPTATVLFTRYQSGRVYGYAAVGWRVGARTVRWAVTGEETRRFTWAGLLEFIGEANWTSLHVVSDLDYIGPASEPPVAEVMGRFGKVERTEDVVSPVVGYGPGRFANGGRVGPYEG